MMYDTHILRSRLLIAVLNSLIIKNMEYPEKGFTGFFVRFLRLRFAAR